MKNERTDIQTYGIKSVINYPSLDFLPILKKIQSREIKGQGGFDYILLRYLYQAIVQYKNESSRNILENTISNVNESAKTYHYEYVWLAVKKYPNSIYKGIIEELNYTDYEIKNLE